ncbi:MAG: hypothetical protein US04_C0001G0488 [Candidatus Nomurabacteria bacterium GW2011_GWD2_36_14]|nr:MAG: hypothetical protein UR97_C0002G0118 [Candidatus Nomurabacteria bacterium GW2011_GWE2_36_115]KKP94523.1 MAG: hypothetical protein US00_C0001G0117 [Candidatus Nomurabacteria bacterium GW2011_GWF2_36_126]KKP96985.1 MAG: hypothetical protein US04_C0001G0488 [Candidatus Nomurabacteria bacterium GW2011_GWD2_36_14]KKP99411.1 MAG: hypothetical protein US08_C0001G0093 [Candidatus Nomurabacteria bacterium GW2011_GWF2_36_19]KKQ05733.1 MAG: hypothetical protein US17_C0002G0117 [Candidatus Nomuraba
MLVISMVIFLWISTFGLLYHMNAMRFEATKNSCLFSSSNECGMTFTEHITLWQGITMSLPQDIFGIVNTILLLITLALTFTFYRNSILEFSRRVSSRFRLYIKQHPQINLFNYLKEVFSSGILNTKIYKVATI